MTVDTEDETRAKPEREAALARPGVREAMKVRHDRWENDGAPSETGNPARETPPDRKPARSPERLRKRKFDIDEFWPPIRGGYWPPGFTVSREQIYDDLGRLTGGPQDNPEDDRRDG